MARGSFFIQRPEDAVRHLDLLVKGLKKVAIAGWVGGAGFAVIAVLLSRLLVTPVDQSKGLPGLRELSGIALVVLFVAMALIVFSCVYWIVSGGLSRHKPWARHTAAGTFLLKVLLCVWLGRSSLVAMFILLSIASWDFYGLWVLLSKETGHLFGARETNQPAVKPANLVT